MGVAFPRRRYFEHCESASDIECQRCKPQRKNMLIGDMVGEDSRIFKGI